MADSRAVALPLAGVVSAIAGETHTPLSAQNPAAIASFEMSILVQNVDVQALSQQQGEAQKCVVAIDEAANGIHRLLEQIQLCPQARDSTMRVETANR